MPSKTAEEQKELKKVQEEYVKVVGPLPGGQWGSNVPHLKKIADVSPTGRAEKKVHPLQRAISSAS